MIIWFGRERDVQYLAELPAVGDYVSHERDLWVVASVEPVPVGTSVVCELRREDDL